MIRALFASVCFIYGLFWSPFDAASYFAVSPFWQAVGMVLLGASAAYAGLIFYAGHPAQKVTLGVVGGAICLPVLMLDQRPNGFAQLLPFLSPWVGTPIIAALFFLLLASEGLTNVRHIFRRRAFGGARWARRGDLAKAGLLKSGGLFLGQLKGRDIYHNADGHILTIGGTGGGKSSGLVVPALLNLTQGSVIVTDPSGELTAMTKRRRAELSDVVILNPFQTVFEQGTGLNYPDTGFNPMSVIDPSCNTFKADCDALARYLMVTDRRESGSYWNDEGTEFLALMIAAIILYDDADLHHLSFLYERVRDNPEAIGQWLEYIIEQGHPALRNEAERFIGIIQYAKPQWAGIASKAALATKRYAPSTPLGEHVKKNGFDAADLKSKNVTVYVLVPPSQLATALPWMNTLIGVFGIAIGRPGQARPVSLLIDEAPSLGYLPDLIPFMAQFRKVGLRVWIFTQTMAQLAAPENYGREGFNTINGLCAIKQFFAISEPEVAKDVSAMCGERTASNVSASTGGASIGDVGVPLFRPEDVRGLKSWQQVIIIDKLRHPIKGWLVPYFYRKEWAAMTDENPYRTSKKQLPENPVSSGDADVSSGVAAFMSFYMRYEVFLAQAIQRGLDTDNLNAEFDTFKEQYNHTDLDYDASNKVHFLWMDFKRHEWERQGLPIEMEFIDALETARWGADKKGARNGNSAVLDEPVKNGSEETDEMEIQFVMRGITTEHVREEFEKNKRSFGVSYDDWVKLVMEFPVKMERDEAITIIRAREA